MSETIVVSQLQKTFRTPLRRKRVFAVKSLSFSVGTGEIFGFLGPNGAGKTTTIKMITGLIKPSSGTVKVLGGEPGSLSVLARMGYLPEHPYFYDYLKPEELLDIFGQLFGISANERKRRIDELLEMVGLGHARGRVLRKFSKGMLQRTGIAQALLNDPELVILDEPLSGLDPVGRKEVIDLIARLKEQGKTVFFSSHILSDIERLCDRVAILDKGEMKATGKLSDLLSGGGNDREIVYAGKTTLSLETLPGVRRVERIGHEMIRLVCEGTSSNKTIGLLLDQNVEIVSVSERRMTLEQLFMASASSQNGVAREESL